MDGIRPLGNNVFQYPLDSVNLGGVRLNSSIVKQGQNNYSLTFHKAGKGFFEAPILDGGRLGNFRCVLDSSDSKGFKKLQQMSRGMDLSRAVTGALRRVPMNLANLIKLL